MHTAIARFLQFLAVERNASPYTVKSYREDLTALAEYLAESPRRPAPAPGDDHRASISAATWRPCTSRATPRRPSPGIWPRCAVFSASASGKAGPRRIPAKPLRNPRKGRSLPHFLSADDLGRLFDAPPADEPMGLRDRAILETMYSAGLRVSEVVGLDDGDSISTAGVLRVRGKGRRERLAPVGSYALRRFAAVAAGARQPQRKQTMARMRLPARRLGLAAGAGVCQSLRPAADDAQRRPDAGEIPASSPAWTPHHAPFAAAQFRHASARPRGRHSQRAGTVGPQEPGDHADLHARQHRGAARSVRAAHPRAK